MSQSNSRPRENSLQYEIQQAWKPIKKIKDGK